MSVPLKYLKFRKRSRDLWSPRSVSNLFPEQQVLNCSFRVLVLCQTAEEKNHFLFSALPHANVSPSLHFSTIPNNRQICTQQHTHRTLPDCTGCNGGSIWLDTLLTTSLSVFVAKIITDKTAAAMTPGLL